MAEEPRTNAEDAVSFLEWKRPGGPWPITAIAPDGNGTPTTWLRSADEVRDFIRGRSGRVNLFYTVGEVEDGVAKKPSKKQLTETVHLHADLDPPKTLAPVEIDGWIETALARVRSQSTVPPPSLIARSGNGLHLLWKLDAAFFLGGDENRAADIEAHNRWIMRELGADPGTWNADRLLRVYGTINLPDNKKREAGRVDRDTRVIDMTDLAYSLAEFGAVDADAPATAGRVEKRAAERGEVCRLTDIAELDEWGIDDADRLRMLIVQGCDPDKFDGDRSKVVCDLCCNLHRRGVPAGLIVGIISDDTWTISEHVIDKGGRDTIGYAWRQVERAIEMVEAEGGAFQTDKDGRPYANQHNVRLALSKMGVTVRFDIFADLPVLDGLPGFGPHLDDAATARLWLRVIEEHNVHVKKDFFWTVIEDAARRDAFHPVAEYLDGLRWDGVERLDRWMVTHLGATESEYARHVGAIMLTAAVRRIRHPGCKFDEIVVLESEQGKSKSTALSILAVHEDWFSDDLPLGADAKVVIERTRGRFIIEAAELAGMNKKGLESLKAFASRRIDRSRMAWGRLPHSAPRHFIIVGTTNDDKYLSDSTGNRRFWPVRVGEIDLDALARDRDQLWAEAAQREAGGASIRLDRSLWQAAAVEQEERRLVDPFVHVLADVVRDLNGKVLSKDVWGVIGTPVGLRTPQLEARLGASMRELGFERGQARFGGNPESCYLRGTKEERLRRIVVERACDEHGTATGPWTGRIEGGAPTAAQPGLGLDDQPY